MLKNLKIYSLISFATKFHKIIFHFQVGTVIHELLHATGFFHEQSRADRDDWVDIIWNNIEYGAADQFEKYSLRTMQYLGANYDYGSVMHYSPYAFSKYPYKYRTFTEVAA